MAETTGFNHEQDFVRPMVMLGEIVTDSEYDKATPEEESTFQKDMDAIREAERRAWVDGRTIIY